MAMISANNSLPHSGRTQPASKTNMSRRTLLQKQPSFGGEDFVMVKDTVKKEKDPLMDTIKALAIGGSIVTVAYLLRSQPEKAAKSETSFFVASVLAAGAAGGLLLKSIYNNIFNSGQNTSSDGLLNTFIRLTSKFNAVKGERDAVGNAVIEQIKAAGFKVKRWCPWEQAHPLKF